MGYYVIDYNNTTKQFHFLVCANSYEDAIKRAVEGYANRKVQIQEIKTKEDKLRVKLTNIPIFKVLRRDMTSWVEKEFLVTPNGRKLSINYKDFNMCKEITDGNLEDAAILQNQLCYLIYDGNGYLVRSWSMNTVINKMMAINPSFGHVEDLSIKKQFYQFIYKKINGTRIVYNCPDYVSTRSVAICRLPYRSDIEVNLYQHLKVEKKLNLFEETDIEFSW